MSDSPAEFVAALAAQDWERLAVCFSPDVDFRALVPSKQPFRERKGGKETAEQLAAWFGDADPLVLLHTSVEALSENVRISYRFGAFEEGQWHVVEQQAYASLEGGRITKLDLVCSGFQPVGERPTA